MNEQEIRNKFFDKGFRTQLRNDPEAILSDLGYILESGIEMRVLTNTKNKTYMIIPARDNEILANIQASGSKVDTVATLGSASSAGTVSTISGTAGTASSVACVGSIGTASKDAYHKH